MPRRFLFTIFIGFCGGIILAEYWYAPIMVLGVVAVCAGIALNWRRSRFVAVLCLAITLGIFRLTAATETPQNSIARYGGQDLVVTGEIFELPETGDRQTIVLDQIKIAGRLASGKVQIYVPSWPTHEPGQGLKVNCRVTALTFASYPRQWSHGIQARCFSAHVISQRPSPSSWRSWLGKVLHRVVAAIERNFNQPQSSLLSGIILGSQSAMPDSLRHQFQATGTTHIVALSGFNVTIIVATMLQLLMRFVGRRWAWVPGLAIVILFVIMSGASASVVRAAIMAVVTQLGLFLGRPIAPGRLLSYTAIVMLWHNPMILLHDLGFQLSFLATIGLVYFSKPIASRLPFVPTVFGLRESLSTTLAAILVTEPLLLWRFGRLSLIAPLVNVLVLPLIPLIMGLGVLWLLGQFIHPLLGIIIQPITDALLRLALWIIATGAGTALSQVFLGGWVAGIVVAMIVIITIQIRRNYDPEADLT